MRYGRNSASSAATKTPRTKISKASIPPRISAKASSDNGSPWFVSGTPDDRYARVIFRHYEPTIPPQVTYGLAARGEELREALDKLNEVSRRWQAEDRPAVADAAE